MWVFYTFSVKMDEGLKHKDIVEPINYQESIREQGYTETLAEQEIAREINLELSVLKEWINTEDTINKKKKIYKSINLGYLPQKVSSEWKRIINKLNQKYQWNESLEWDIWLNEQIWLFFSDTLSKYNKNYSKRMDKYLRNNKKNKLLNEIKQTENLEQWKNEKKEQGQESKEFQTFEEYCLANDNPENFENFLVSNEVINIIQSVADLNSNDEKVFASKTIFEKDIHSAWQNKLLREYNAKYNIEYDEKTIKIENTLKFIIKDCLDFTVSDYLKRWWNKSWVWLRERIDNILENIGDNENIRELLKDFDFMDKLKSGLITRISNFAFVWDKNKEFSLNTGDIQVDLNLRSYLFAYGKLFHPELFNIKWWEFVNYESTLSELLDAILYNNWDVLKLKNENSRIAKAEAEKEKRRIEREKQRREKAIQENRKRNEKLQSMSPQNREIKWFEKEQKYLDIQNASWAEIAANEKLWNQLSNFEIKTNNNFIENRDKRAKWMAFGIAFNKFLQYNSEMKDMINIWKMRELYDFENNSIRANIWESFKNHNLVWFSDEEKNVIYNKIISFPNEINNVAKKLWEKSDSIIWKFWETVKTHAIGAVIDNVKNIFSQMWNEKLWAIFQWFQFNENLPAKISWNDMIISWKVNWTNMNIRYDLKTGELFINSFLQETINPNKITIWNEEPNYKIWQLASFDTILDEYYKMPTISMNNDINNQYDLYRNIQVPNNTKLENSDNQNKKVNNKPKIRISNRETLMRNRERLKNENKLKFQQLFGKEIDIMWEMIKSHTEKQSTKNSIINAFAKTFNIIPDIWDSKSIEFLEWSNLFDVLQIIENSDSESLSNFSIFMDKIMKYSWLNRWKNNEQLNIKNWFSEKIFDMSEWINAPNSLYLKNKIKSFNNEKDINKGKVVFDNWSSIWFADVIKEKITIWDKPNRKLDTNKMIGFLKAIESESTESLTSNNDKQDAENLLNTL